MIRFGVIENRDDPLLLGRCQVRVVGLHTPNKKILPTDDLPWALIMQPATSAAISGIGISPVGLVPGSWVVVIYQDEPDCQQPIIIGSIGGIPGDTAVFDAMPGTEIYTKDDNGSIIKSPVVATNDGELKKLSDTGEPPIDPPGPAVYEKGGLAPLPTELSSLEPPKWYGTLKGGETDGIAAIVASCNKYEVTDINAQATMLGISGALTGWIPIEENRIFLSTDDLIRNHLYAFSGMTFEEATAAAQPYVDSKGEGLFDYVYGPESLEGQLVGNINEGDGEKFMGRGLIMLPGNTAYRQAALDTGHNIYSGVSENAPPEPTPAPSDSPKPSSGGGGGILDSLSSMAASATASGSALIAKVGSSSLVSKVGGAAALSAVGGMALSKLSNANPILGKVITVGSGALGAFAAYSSTPVPAVPTVPALPDPKEDPSPDGDPTLLMEIDVAADVFVFNIKQRYTDAGLIEADPSFFPSVYKLLNPEGEPPELAQKLYEYFLGRVLASSPSAKDSSASDNPVVDTPVPDTSTTNQTTATTTANTNTATDTSKPVSTFTPHGGDRTYNTVIGFTDPQGKYPLRDHIYEPDTNRLARGVAIGTCLAWKEKTRTTGIPGPFVTTWEQPPVPSGTRYPYNKVFESESGHVNEIDDTPGAERLSNFHRTGTFTEIDNNGTQVNKIVGDSYQIIDRNGSIYIVGKATVTVDGSINILCNESANIEVMGNANVDVRKDATIGVHRDASLGVGRDMFATIGRDSRTEVARNMDVQVEGHVSMRVGCKAGLGNSVVHTHIIGTVYSTIEGDVKSEITGNVDQTIVGDTNTNITGNVSQVIVGDVNNNITGKVDEVISGNVDMNITGDFGMKTSGDMNFDAGGALNIVTGSTIMISGGGSTSIDAPKIDLNSGMAGSATVGSAPSAADAPTTIVEAPLAVIDAHIPLAGIVVGSAMLPKQPSSRSMGGGSGGPGSGGSKSFGLCEIPDEIDPDLDAYKKEILEVDTAIDPAAAHNTPAEGYGKNIDPLDRGVIDSILNTGEFQLAYILSDRSNIKLGDFIKDTGGMPKNSMVSDTLDGELYQITKQQIILNLKMVAMNILEPMYDLLGGKTQVSILSTYRQRSKFVIKGKTKMTPANGPHLKGLAIDVQPINGKNDAVKTHALIVELQKVVSYDQIILIYEDPFSGSGESRKCWIHISLPINGIVPRYDAFTELNGERVAEGFSLL